MSREKINFVFFGSSQFSHYVLEALAVQGLEPILNISSSKEVLPTLPEADVYIVASFGKILPKEVIDRPKYKTLNVHPSLLPKLRGPAPIQNAIISESSTGVSIMLMDEKMDHGPILAATPVDTTPWPDRYSIVEEKLGQAGGKLLAEVLPKWINGGVEAIPQDHTQATYTKLIKKEDADISKDSPETAYRKILAYEVWPRARLGDLIITKAHLEEGALVIDRVLPPGKKDMNYKDYLRGRV